MTAPATVGTDPRTADVLIEALDLRRVYGSGTQAFVAVDGVSLQVRRGELFALLGTNGAGKTSTLEVLEGLVAPSDGTARVFGLDPRRERPATRPRMGIMVQSGGFPSDLTIREVLTMWTGTLGNPMPVEDALALVALTHRADVRVKSLSGGEKRRLDLACALAGHPEVVFLDEPTTGLDPESRRATWNLIDDIRNRGAAVVLTTHYLDEAEHLADRLAIMHRGVIVRAGTVEEVVAGHPALITLADPGVPLPELPETTVERSGSRLSITTPALQQTLTAVLDWARAHDIALEALTARSASLESVFLEIAGMQRS